MSSDDHPHVHRVHRSPWLRAAVLGANDGLISTASLVMGVAAARSSADTILLTGVAGLVAGSLSMAAGEYVSVSSQADTVRADLETERLALEQNEEFERRELAKIYEDRGLDAELAKKVADQLMDHNALAAHARDELGIVDDLEPNPVQASVYSAIAFAFGAALPLIVAWRAPTDQLIWILAGSTVLFLAGLGALAARVGGAPILRGALRVTMLGVAAMAITFGVGRAFGVEIG